MRVSIQQYWDLLIGYLRSQSGRVIGLAVLLFTSIGLQLVNPQIMRNYLDSALAGGIPSPTSLTPRRTSYRA